VRSFSEARIEHLYRGIDAVFYLDRGMPRYDLVIAAGADPNLVAMTFDGANGIRTTRDGLAIGTSMGELAQRGLFAYQFINGVRTKVECNFAMRANGSVGFAMGAYDRSKPLVIDPLIYSTYIGGSGTDQSEAGAVAVDASGHIYVTGFTIDASTDFPTTSGAYDIGHNGGSDVFVSKLDPSASGSSQLVYSTFIGTSGTDVGQGIDVDDDGKIYVAGTTSSSAFPTTSGAYDTGHNGGYSPARILDVPWWQCS
jgi:DNA-binding beta-propeller fold protein YncE